MINLSEIKPTKEHTPLRVLLYGPEKVGKSTFAATAPNPLFISMEGGLDRLEVAKQRCNNYKEVIDVLTALKEQDHEFKTVVFDPAGWLEEFIYGELCKEENVSSIDEVGGGYGKGYTVALNKWNALLTGLEALRLNKHINIVFLAHMDTRTYQNPAGEDYDRFYPKLHGKTTKGNSVMTLLTQWCDAILLANYKVYTKKEDAGFGKKQAKGVGNGERVLYTTESPAFVAGNRLDLPSELPLTNWDEVFSKQLSQPEQEKE